MGSRLMESFKMHMKSYKKQKTKEQQQKGVPTFRNFSIPPQYSTHYEELTAYVVDLLSKEPYKVTKILNIRRYRSTYLITSIKCPLCGSVLDIDYHWFAFICENHAKKKIYDIILIETPKEAHH